MHRMHSQAVQAPVCSRNAQHLALATLATILNPLCSANILADCSCRHFLTFEIKAPFRRTCELKPVMTLAWMPPAMTIRGMLAVTTSVIFHPLLKAMRYATADRHTQHHHEMTWNDVFDHLRKGVSFKGTIACTSAESACM